MAVLEPLLGVKGAAAWKQLLVGRSYHLEGHNAALITERATLPATWVTSDSCVHDSRSGAVNHIVTKGLNVLGLPEHKFFNQGVRYSVGQPMGALSSWAMLALTHHLLVQYAHALVHPYKMGQPWFEGYELLGDDIVIFDELTASSYLSVMERLGVGINLSKSVCSKGETFEFAKVTGHNGLNVSALS